MSRQGVRRPRGRAPCRALRARRSNALGAPYVPSPTFGMFPRLTMLTMVTSDRVRWLLLGIAAIALVVHSLAYNFVTDDAYISFVFSRNFAEHGELSFNLGYPVEGYTNFLWTVVLGLLMIVGIAPELSS